MSDEELAALEEELTTARTEIDRLSEAAADAHARASQMEATTANLRKELAQSQSNFAVKDSELTSANADLASTRAAEESLRGELVEAQDQAKSAALNTKTPFSPQSHRSQPIWSPAKR